jgi:hypothetical protein
LKRKKLYYPYEIELSGIKLNSPFLFLCSFNIFNNYLELMIQLWNNWLIIGGLQVTFDYYLVRKDEDSENKNVFSSRNRDKHKYKYVFRTILEWISPK